MVSINFLQIAFNSSGGPSSNIWIMKKKSFPVPLPHIAFLLSFSLVSSILDIFSSVPYLKVIDSNASSICKPLILIQQQPIS